MALYIIIKPGYSYLSSLILWVAVIVDLHPDRPDERGAALSKPDASGQLPDVLEYVGWGPDPSPQELQDAGGQVLQGSKWPSIF